MELNATDNSFAGATVVIDFATMVRSLRSELDLTQQQFGQLVNSRCETVSRWENNRLTPDVWQTDMILTLLRAVESKPNMLEAKEMLKLGLTGQALAVILRGIC